MNTAEKQVSTQIGLQAAANVDYLGVQGERARNHKSIGWDAYEVWQRMIKEPRDQRNLLKREP